MPSACFAPIKHGEFPGRWFSNARNNRVIQKEHRWLWYSVPALICQSGRHILPSLCCTVPPCMIIYCCIGILACWQTGVQPRALILMQNVLHRKKKMFFQGFCQKNIPIKVEYIHLMFHLSLWNKYKRSIYCRVVLKKWKKKTFKFVLNEHFYVGKKLDGRKSLTQLH